MGIHKVALHEVQGRLDAWPLRREEDTLTCDKCPFNILRLCGRRVDRGPTNPRQPNVLIAALDPDSPDENGLVCLQAMDVVGGDRHPVMVLEGVTLVPLLELGVDCCPLEDMDECWLGGPGKKLWRAVPWRACRGSVGVSRFKTDTVWRLGSRRSGLFTLLNCPKTALHSRQSPVTVRVSSPRVIPVLSSLGPVVAPDMEHRDSSDLQRMTSTAGGKDEREKQNINLRSAGLKELLSDEPSAPKTRAASAVVIGGGASSSDNQDLWEGW
ncbi:hypothetical protein C8F04DRAFT_1182404 [Mycena alexandri]|uniref:Uncharacterized protein n=1 Tax=Mycena alexandri TaxID=1745969 RepID=A0AAD6SZM6_9AGAR|nr:hypothetical protein C8F04DRAFT_1182404 [Mycena alexandri]